MACVELYTVSLRSSSDSLDFAQAVMLAEGLLEETLADGYLIAETDSGDFGEAFPKHEWESEITETDLDTLMLVRIVVKWTARGVEKQYELTTLHADRSTTESLFE